ncbi:hypothetical protein EXIGLDRAFT_834829 [Exidia glandulosa HHB12029]|uniref:Uncharacterized protein n=1 Tax=Exidia glandulosa HHB12029 TaxID=1314781 RepID=A0A165JBP7_EXIGL|nr:hypothetical protein EXIGLDRAFT_834829 [Exidia glandulosa HHB12029]
MLEDALWKRGRPTDQRFAALGAPINGVLTTYKVVPSEALVSFPEHLSYEEASTLPCAALTAS